MKGGELIIDSFAGGGGASLGIEWATGRSPDVAINHDPKAIEMHAANHPATKHYKEDVFQINPREVTRGRPVGLLWLSPDCFPAGTMVLTTAGYKAIETIRVGDLVLTHKNRWRPVTETMSSVKTVRTIRGHGHPGLTVSDEHPFYVSYRENVWDNDDRHYKPSFGAAGWVKASDLKPLTGKFKNQCGHYWATPTEFEPLPVPQVGGRGLTLDENAWWLIGRYLADGWTRLEDKRSELVLVCGKHKIDEMRRRLSVWETDSARAGRDEFKWQEVEYRTALQFRTSHRGLIEYLRLNFGHLAHGKVLPGWALGMSIENRRSLLAGYVAGDGYDGGNMVQIATVSPALAYGIKSLAGSLGYTPTVHTGSKGGKATIEGREVNTQTSLRVHWRHAVDADHKQTFDAGGHRYSAIREITPGDQPVQVFNISVDEDESYVVDGIIVHNCKHFSRAKGGKPVEKKIRGLAWVAIKWAVEAHPRVIVLENVREFQDWGPLVHRWVCRANCGWKGTESQTKLVRSRHRCPRCDSLRVSPTEDMVPCPLKKGLTFKQFVGRLKACGYEVEWQVLNAADFGAPTHRRRLFLVARRDGEPINWPEPTHGDPKKIGKDLFSLDTLPWRTAAECIDWSIPCPSIFDRKKPLAEKTLKRIALGTKRYVLDNPKPFIVDMQRENRARGVDEPTGTVTTQGNKHNLVTPVITPVTHAGERRANGPEEPLPTVTGANRGELAVIAPVLANLAHGDAKDGRCRGLRVNEMTEPMGTVHAGGGSFSVIAPTLLRQFGGSDAAAVDAPLGTVVAGGMGKSLLVAPTLIQTGYGEATGQAPRALDIERPLGTVVSGGKHALVSAFVAKHFGGVVGVPADVPLPTVTAIDHNAVVAANLVHMNHGEKTSSSPDEPARTVTASGTHAALVYSFMTKYFGRGVGAGVDQPAPTVTAKDRFGLVTVTIDGVEFVITDIGMRMLKPRELARAQGFPDSVKLTGTATNQVERIGNSVVPQVAEAVVRAQGFTPAAKRVKRARKQAAA